MCVLANPLNFMLFLQVLNNPLSLRKNIIYLIALYAKLSEMFFSSFADVKADPGGQWLLTAAAKGQLWLGVWAGVRHTDGD